MQITEGVKLGTYEILERLGEGGMGVVHRARDTRLNRQVAVKVLSSALSSDPQARERLRREAVAAAALDHPYVCKVFEIGEDHGLLFMVMEYLPGKTLHQRLIAEKIGLVETLRVAVEVAEALEEAHARLILHRDLKPANIMLTAQGHVKVMDFGLAKQMTGGLADSAETMAPGEGQLTMPGTVLGTPDYMSPEQISGLELDARSDQFSFGIVLAEMLSGSHPFRKSTMMETLSAVLRDSPEIRGDMPQSLRVVVRRMLAKSPDDRFDSMADVRADLKRMSKVAESGPDEQAQDRIPPIGRDAELKLLTRHLEDAMAGRGSILLIGGEPGIGKTHLITALAENAGMRGALVRIGHCYEAEGSPPYGPIIEHLETTLRTGTRKTLRFALGDDAAEIARVMPELRNVFPDIPPPLELPPDQQRRLLFNSYRSFLERVAHVTPVVFVYEDMHWADEPTLLLLESLAKAVSELPALIVFTYRDVDLEVGRPFARTLEHLLRQKLATRILLRRLPVEGVEKMLAALSAQTPPPSLARVVFEETEGNPYFVEEVFRHLAEEGKLFDEQGAFLQGLKVDQLQVPEGVRLVLGRRLQRLSDDARRILTTAAVIGRSYPLELLEDLEKAQSGAHPDAALDAVEEAERAHLVESESRGRQTRYRFVHELVRQTLIETLSLPRRQRLHARIADAIERVYSHSLDAHVPALAHHLYEAGAAVDTDKAVGYLSQAAQRAAAAAAHEEAIEHLDKALSILEDERSVRAGDLSNLRGSAMLGSGRDEEAIQAFERAIDIFEGIGDHARFVDACMALSDHLIWTLRFAQFVPHIARMERAAQSSPPFVRWAFLMCKAMMRALAGGIDDALQLLDEAAALSHEGRTPRMVLLGYFAESRLRFYAGQIDLGAAAARKCRELSDSGTDLWLVAGIASSFVYGHLMLGRPAEALKTAREMVSIATRVGHDNARHISMAMMGATHAALGQLDLAEQAAREAIEFGRSTGASYGSIFEVGFGFLFVCVGKVDEGLALLRQEWEHGPGFTRGTSEGAIAMGLAACGLDATEAEAACRAAMNQPGMSRSLGMWSGVVCLIEALAIRGRVEEAADLLPQAERVAAEWDTTSIGYPAHTAAGIAAAGAGDWVRSEQHHRAAIARMDEAGYKFGQPIARLRYADMLLMRAAGKDAVAGDAAAAEELLKTSLAQSQAIGLALYARLAREKLAGL